MFNFRIIWLGLLMLAVLASTDLSAREVYRCKVEAKTIPYRPIECEKDPITIETLDQALEDAKAEIIKELEAQGLEFEKNAPVTTAEFYVQGFDVKESCIRVMRATKETAEKKCADLGRQPNGTVSIAVERPSGFASLKSCDCYKVESANGTLVLACFNKSMTQCPRLAEPISEN